MHTPPPKKKEKEKEKRHQISSQATSTEADASKTFEEKRQPRSKSLWVLSSLLHFSGEESFFFWSFCIFKVKYPSFFTVQLDVEYYLDAI